MKRNVISLAGKTNVISLPSGWCKRFNIQKGEELDVEERGSSLIITTDASNIKEKIALDASGLNERSLRWAVSALNKAGFDEIEIYDFSKEKIEVIEDLRINLLTGFSLIEKTERRIVLKSMMKDSDEEFDNALRRAFLVGLEMADECAKNLDDKEKLKELLQLEKQNNQLTNFCERILNRKGHSKSKKTHFYYTIIWNLEKIVDEYKYVCKKGIKTNESRKALIFANSIFREYYNLFYKFEEKKLTEISEKIRGFKMDEVENSTLPHIYSILEKCQDFSASIFAIHKLE